MPCCFTFFFFWNPWISPLPRRDLNRPPLQASWKVGKEQNPSIRSMYGTWNPKQPFIWMFGETTIFYIEIWNHPIETSIDKWLFGVPGMYAYIYPINYPHVGKSTIHWVSGIRIETHFASPGESKWPYSDLFIPKRWRSPLQPFQNVTFSPSQKGHGLNHLTLVICCI